MFFIIRNACLDFQPYTWLIGFKRAEVIKLGAIILRGVF